MTILSTHALRELTGYGSAADRMIREIVDFFTGDDPFSCGFSEDIGLWCREDLSPPQVKESAAWIRGFVHGYEFATGDEIQG